MAITNSSKFPKQRLSYYDKKKKDFKWAKEMIDTLAMNRHEGQLDYYRTADQQQGRFRDDYHRKLSNYQLYNNILNQRDFENELNPMGLEVGKFKDSIKPYNKTTNKINVLLGEESKRPLDFRTTVLDQEGVNSKIIQRDLDISDHVEDLLEQANKLIREHHAEEFRAMQQQQQSQQNPDQPSPETSPQSRRSEGASQQELQQKLQDLMNKYLDPKSVKRLEESNYVVKKEKAARRVLEYLMVSQDIKGKRNDAFKHALLTAEEPVYVGIENDEPVIKVLNPLGFFYSKDPDTKWIQDGLYAGYRTLMSGPDVIHKFGQYLTEKDVKRIEGATSGVYGMRDDIVGKTMKYDLDADVDYEYHRRAHADSTHEGQYGRLNTHGAE